MKTKKNIRNIIFIFLIITILFSSITLFIFHEMKEKIEKANTLECELVSIDGESQTICDDKELNKFTKLLIDFKVYYFFMPFVTLIVFTQNAAIKLLLVILNIFYFLFLAIMVNKLFRKF